MATSSKRQVSAARLVSDLAERLRRLANAYGEWEEFEVEPYFDLYGEQTALLVHVSERVSTVHVIFFADAVLPSFQAAVDFLAQDLAPARFQNGAYMAAQAAMSGHWQHLVDVVQQDARAPGARRRFPRYERRRRGAQPVAVSLAGQCPRGAAARACATAGGDTNAYLIDRVSLAGLSPTWQAAPPAPGAAAPPAQCSAVKTFACEQTLKGMMPMQTLLVTGGAGFIGCNFVRYMLDTHPDVKIVVYDKLTYAGRLENLQDIQANHARRFDFVHGDICDAAAVEAAIAKYGVDTIVNFAAETHVDRSIMDPDAFIQTDVYGTYVLLEAARKAGNLRYHQISTDEVYGHIHGDHRSLES